MKNLSVRRHFQIYFKEYFPIGLRFEMKCLFGRNDAYPLRMRILFFLKQLMDNLSLLSHMAVFGHAKEMERQDGLSFYDPFNQA
jgi:hypothetical protein